MNEPSVAGWGGIFPASLTMFDRTGRLDLEAMREHVSRLVARGADGIVVCGTTGEFVGLTDEERIEVVEAAVEGAGGRVPVIAGTGAYGTEATIALTERAAAAGAAGAIVILPYYMRPQRAEVLRFYEEVGGRSSIPVMLYNNPANSAAAPLEADDIGRLAAAGTIQAVKSTFPTVHQVHEVRAATSEDFRTFYGSFMAPLEGLAGGAHGWISGILNVVLEDALAMHAAVARGDLPGAREAWARVYPYKLLYTRGPLGAVGDIPLWRAVLELRGEHGGSSRRPILDLGNAERVAIGQFLDEATSASEPVYG